MSLGQGLCGYVPLAREVVLKDASSIKAGTVGQGDLIRSIKEGCLITVRVIIHTRVAGGGAGFKVPGWELGGSQLLPSSCLRYPGVEASLTHPLYP